MNPLRTGDRAVRRPSHNRDSAEPRQHPRCAIGGAESVRGIAGSCVRGNGTSRMLGSAAELPSQFFHRADRISDHEELGSTVPELQP